MSRSLGRVDKRTGAQRLSRTPQRPSIIRPAPGRYVNVGIEEGFRSSSCLVWLTSCSFGRSTSCALQPMSAVKSKSAITDLSRIILSSHFGDYGSPNIVSQKGKDAPRSQYLGQIVQIAQDLIVGEISSITRLTIKLSDRRRGRAPTATIAFESFPNRPIARRGRRFATALWVCGFLC